MEELLGSLKEFHPVKRPLWRDVSDALWNDWRWHLKNRITTPAQLERFLPSLTREERAGALLADKKLALGVTPLLFQPYRWGR